MNVQSWGPERIEELVAHVASVMPTEDLTADEVFTACFDQPGIVLASDAGDGVVAVGVGRAFDGEVVAAIRLLAVRPDDTALHRGLLDVAQEWARDQGASRLEIGGALPFPLWPGVDAASGLATIALGLGYTALGDHTAHALPSSFRSEPPVGVDIRRAVRDEDVVAVAIAAAALWPWWSDEIARALEHGTCHIATAIDPVVGEHVVGLGCHSITRATWVGPLVVVGTHQRCGIGHALLGQICRDLMIADFPLLEIPVVDSPEAEAFFVAAGSTPVRSYRRMVLELR